MNLSQAQTIAGQLIAQLAPACIKCEIAGSVRRQKPDPKDLEIVCVPRIIETPAMFGVSEHTNMLEALIADELMAADQLGLDDTLKRNGPKYKRLFWGVHPGGIAVDLFIADPGNFGNILAIRTGDAQFSKMLVTQRRLGGLMPSYLKQKDGYLWNGIDLICCPTEADFFEALNVKWVEPRERCGETAMRLAKYA